MSKFFSYGLIILIVLAGMALFTDYALWFAVAGVVVLALLVAWNIYSTHRARKGLVKEIPLVLTHMPVDSTRIVMRISNLRSTEFYRKHPDGKPPMSFAPSLNAVKHELGRLVARGEIVLADPEPKTFDPRKRYRLP